MEPSLCTAAKEVILAARGALTPSERKRTLPERKSPWQIVDSC